MRQRKKRKDLKKEEKGFEKNMKLDERGIRREGIGQDRLIETKLYDR